MHLPIPASSAGGLPAEGGSAMKRATLVSLVLMIPILCGGCAVDALTWALTGFGMVSGLYQPDYGPKSDPPVCVEAYMGKRATGATCSPIAR
jgi:hypothetical protein